MLDRGADVNIENGMALRIAANNGRIDLVKLLLNKGADVTVRTADGGTALMDAVREGHIEIVNLLFDKGANGVDGNVLWVAIQNGRTELVKLLLDKGSNANVKTRTNQTALMEAIRLGQPEIIKLLLDKGADANVKDQNNKTALILALEINEYNKNKKNIIRIILEQAKGIDVNVTNFYGTPALFLSGGDNEIIKTLIDKGADVNARDANAKYPDTTALMEAVISDNIEIVKILLDKGANINLQAKYGDTALMKAVQSGNVEIVKILLDKGADTNIKRSDGYTALMNAIMSNNINIVKLLLDKGADINIKGVYGDTALVRARPYPEIAQLLKNVESHQAPSTVAPASASPETQTKTNQTPPINPTTQVANPSFDCTKASTNAEHLICSNADLVAADVEMVQIYKNVLNKTIDKNTLKQEQKQWRKNQRDACNDVACMLKVYKDHTNQLSGKLDQIATATQNSNSSLTADSDRDKKRAEYKKAFSGKWKGTYLCGQGITGLTLDISTTQQSMRAIFNFYPVQQNPNVGSGSFSLAGEFSMDGYFKLKPNVWINQPQGFSMVGMSGKISDNRKELIGSIDSGCSSFHLYK